MGKDREARDAAMVLTSLLVGGRGQLEVFRRRRAADPEIDIEHLERARDMVLFLFRAITVAGDEDVWEKVEQAWEVLNGEGAVEAPRASEAGGDAPEDAPALEPEGKTDEAASPASESPPTEPIASEPRKPARVGDPVVLGPDAPPIFDEKRSPEPGRLSSKWGDVASRAPVVAPPPAPVASVDAAEDPIGSTAQMRPGAEHLDDARAVPFAAGEAAPEPVSPALARHQAAGQTLTGEVDMLQTLPFDEPLGGPLEPHLAAITMDQYAALSAECSIRPERRAAAYARYEIAGERERERLDAYWTARLGGDEMLAARFRELIAHYEKWVRSEP